MSRNILPHVSTQRHKDPGHRSNLAHHNNSVLDFPLGQLYVGDHFETNGTMGKEKHRYSHIVYGGIFQSNNLACWKIDRLKSKPIIDKSSNGDPSIRPAVGVNDGWNVIGWTQTTSDQWCEVFQKKGQPKYWYAVQDMQSPQSPGAKVHVWAEGYADYKYEDSTGGRQRRMKDIKKEVKEALSRYHDTRPPPPTSFKTQPAAPEDLTLPAEINLVKVKQEPSDDADDLIMLSATVSENHESPGHQHAHGPFAMRSPGQDIPSGSVTSAAISQGKPAGRTSFAAWSVDALRAEQEQEARRRLRRQQQRMLSRDNVLLDYGRGDSYVCSAGMSTTGGAKRKIDILFNRSGTRPRSSSHFQGQVSPMSRVSEMSSPSHGRGRFGDSTAPGACRDSAIPIDSDDDADEGDDESCEAIDSNERASADNGLQQEVVQSVEGIQQGYESVDSDLQQIEQALQMSDKGLPLPFYLAGGINARQS